MTQDVTIVQLVITQQIYVTIIIMKMIVNTVKMTQFTPIVTQINVKSVTATVHVLAPVQIVKPVTVTVLA